MFQQRRRLARSIRPRREWQIGPRKAATELVTEFCLLCVVGSVVFLVMAPFLHGDLLRGIDRSIIDWLMRRVAGQQLLQPLESEAPRFVYIDIGEETCRLWAEEQHTSCTLGVTTRRDHLAKILRSIGDSTKPDGAGPDLVAIDIEMAPLPRNDEDGKKDPANGETLARLDRELCTAVIHMAQRVRVVVMRPMVISGPSELVPFSGFRSIVDDADCGVAAAKGTSPRNLWFASAVIQPDSDGVLRSVHTWDYLWDETAAQPEIKRIAGIGFLGAALLDQNIDPDDLTCLFTASKPSKRNCGGANIEKIRVGGKDYVFTKDWNEDKWKPDRIRFSLPFEPRWQGGASGLGYAPAVIDTVEAFDFERRLGENPKFLNQAVVIVGGSYLASGDLHKTPLGPGMPGAVVQANAIRAYATGNVIQETGFLNPAFWEVKLTLIPVAALIGAVFHVLGLLITGPAPTPRRRLARILVSLVGVVVAGLAVFGIGTVSAFRKLVIAGEAIGTLTPTLAVVLEGGCSTLHQLKQLIPRDESIHERAPSVGRQPR